MGNLLNSHQLNPSRKWASLKPDIVALLKSAALFCNRRPVGGGQYSFFQQLLALSEPTCCPTLLTFVDDDENCAESTDFLEELHVFLVGYLATSRGASDLKGDLKGVLVREYCVR